MKVKEVNYMSFELTKISPKGQVVIPQKIRDALHISPGSRFVVYVKDDQIIFKKLELPATEDL